MTVKNAMVVLSALAVLTVHGVEVSSLDESGMFPFVPSYDSPANVVDMSHLLSAPAGKDGRIRVQDGHFVNDRGRVRLHATNLTGPSNFPTHEEAERLAARLARFGINCVRLHYFDADYGNFMQSVERGIIADDFRTRRRLDAERRDRQDYLVAQFKRRGIYVDVNLHVARTLDARDGFPGGNPWANKGVDQFDPRVIELEKEYARDLLDHVNPYTGMSYLKDPVVAIVELNNEDALWNQYRSGGMDNLSPTYATIFKNLWNDWLVKRYGTAEKMHATWAVVKTPLGEEQVPEGRFEAEVVPDGKTWTLDLGGTAAAGVVAQDGVLRMTVTKPGGDYCPKLYRRVAVKKGLPYTVSFRIRRVRGASGEIGFAVADRSKGWESLGLLKRFSVGEKWSERKFSFFGSRDVAAAELQFTRFGEGVYEIDDLSFRAGADFPDLTGLDPNRGELPIVRSRDAAPPPVALDFSRFLCDTEHAYWTGMHKYLKEELGLEAPVSATQLGYSPPHLQAELDFVDHHAYWCHPNVTAKWQIQNRAMVNSLGGCVADLAGQRVAGKPFTVSEYNHPYPIFYGAEGQPMLRAYGALQGWDGVFEYSYNNRQNAEPDHNEYFFSMAARTDVLAHFPACAAIYLRGDVKESLTTTVGDLPFSDYLERLATGTSVAQGIVLANPRQPATAALVHGVAVDVTPEVRSAGEASTPCVAKHDGTVFVSDTKELRWDVSEKGAGIWTVNTDGTKLFTGFPKGRTIDLGGVWLKLGETKLGWATVSLVSHDATGFGEGGRPARILLTATALCHNGGAKFTAHGDDAISCRGDDWGDGKTVCEGVPATVTLSAPAAKTVCRALDERGEPKAEVPVAADAEGRAVIEIGPAYRTVWYEVVVR